MVISDDDDYGKFNLYVHIFFSCFLVFASNIMYMRVYVNTMCESNALQMHLNNQN